MLRILLSGYSGRMGRAIRWLTEELPTDRVVAGINSKTSQISPDITYNSVIDFSLPQGTLQAATYASAAKCPLVIGTTGHSPQQRAEVLKRANNVPVVWCENCSVGTNVLFYLLQQGLACLSSDFQAEIVEMHHAQKLDAPSGTARRLAAIIQDTRPEAKIVNGREGKSGPRPEAEIGVHAIRAGDIVGVHRVLLAGKGEFLELSHTATDRNIFARGALRAASWALNQPPGLYTMQDVLGMRRPS